MEDIMQAIAAMNAAAVNIDRGEYKAMPEYFAIGKRAAAILATAAKAAEVEDAKAKAKMLDRITVCVDGENVVLSSQSKIALATGIAQTTISRAVTIVGRFDTSSDAVAAYKAFDGVFSKWVSTLVSKSSNRKGSGKKAPTVDKIVALAKGLTKAQRRELIATLQNMK